MYQIDLNLLRSSNIKSIYKYSMKVLSKNMHQAPNSEDETIKNYNKLMQKLSAKPGQNFAALQPNMRSPKQALKEVLNHWNSIDENTTFKMFEDKCGHLDCWQFVAEQDRVELFNAHISTLTAPGETDQESLVLANMSALRCQFYEKQSSLLKMHLEMLKLEEVRANKKTLELRKQLLDQDKKIENLQNEIAAIDEMKNIRKVCEY